MDSDLLNKINAFYKIAAILQAPKEMIKEVTSWAYSIYCGAVLKMVEDEMKKLLPKRHKYKKDLKRLAFVRALCLKYYRPTDENPQGFALNLDDIPYFTQVEQEKSQHDTVIIARFIFAPEEAKTIDNGGWRGLYINNGTILLHQRLFPIETITEEILIKVLELIEQTVRHELQHLVQFYMQKIKNLKEVGGLPSSKIRDPDFNYSGKSEQYQNRPHQLHDIEFYTNLTDSIARFRAVLPKFPAALHQLLLRVWIGQNTMEELERATVQEYQKNKSLLKKWLGARTLQEILPEAMPYIKNGRDFFNALKANEFGKYKKAVAEFYKAVQSQL